MGLFSPNPAKLRQIELQNILFDTEEKKLMVSTDFLNDMTTSYVSKRMKIINQMTDRIVVTKNPNNFFTCCDVIYQNLEELIKIEPYHNFKEPVPSEFKKIFDSQKGKYIESMIKRTWRDITQKTGMDADGNRDPKYYGPVLDALLKYKEEYSPSQLELVDKFYKLVYGVSFHEMEKEEEPEIPENEEAMGTEGNEVPEDELVLSEAESEAEDDIEEVISIGEEDSE